jgi:hypothetical protein
MVMEGEGLTGNWRVRVIRPALWKVYKLFPKRRHQMEIRANALKLRYWPDMEVTGENGIVI